MPKKQIDDDEDIIEIEEFSEPKQGKSGSKQISDKKAKKKQPPPSESEEEESEEEEEEPVKKSKPKKKKPISEKRLEVLKKGREIAAANRAKKKEEQIAKLKKELWEDFNGKIPRAERSTSEAVKNVTELKPVPPPPQSQNLSHPQEIISKMKERASLDPPSQTSGRKIKSFCKIKI